MLPEVLCKVLMTPVWAAGTLAKVINIGLCDKVSSWASRNNFSLINFWLTLGKLRVHLKGSMGEETFQEALQMAEGRLDKCTENNASSTCHEYWHPQKLHLLLTWFCSTTSPRSQRKWNLCLIWENRPLYQLAMVIQQCPRPPITPQAAQPSLEHCWGARRSTQPSSWASWQSKLTTV